MKEGRTLPVIQPAPDAGLSRRAALQTLAAGLGASIAVPGLAEADDHPVHKHVAGIAEQAKKPSAATKAAPAYTPTTFDAHQFSTVVVLSELIVPGAKASGTPEFLDKLLTVEPPETRRRFITALGAMDRAALGSRQKPFKDLAQADQVALLTEASTGQPSRQPVYWKKGDPIPVPEPPPGPATLRDHFDHIKGWVSGIYFASEPGLKELGYTGNVFHEKFAGCPHDGKHA
jgi:Gluconate 2-dehydrogenase subunit 3